MRGQNFTAGQTIALRKQRATISNFKINSNNEMVSFCQILKYLLLYHVSK